MIIKRYYDLTHRERMEIIGKLVIAIESNDEFFDKGLQLISEAEVKGVYEKVNVGEMLQEPLPYIPPIGSGSEGNTHLTNQ